MTNRSNDQKETVASKLKQRLSRHFGACTKAAAVLATVAAGSTAPAAIVHWSAANIVIPATTSGVYIKLDGGGSSATSPMAGWDLNPWSGSSLSWFNPTAPAGGVYMQFAGGPTTPGNQPLGTMVDGSALWGSGAVATAGPGAWILNSSDNYIGFRFQGDDSQIHYGWARVQLGASVTDPIRNVIELAWEDEAGVGILVGATAPPLVYCDAAANNDDGSGPDTGFGLDERIINVAVDGINNPSTDAGSTAPAYQDFTSVVGNMLQGATYPITIDINSDFGAVGGGYDSNQAQVWIDYNQDGDFDDLDELVFTSVIGSADYTGNITIPVDAPLGQTRMRVRLNDTEDGTNYPNVNNLTPCGFSTYGEVEDYTVNIVDFIPPGTECGAYTNGTDVPIVDMSTVSSIISTGPQGGALVQDMNVYVVLSHTFVSDLTLTLESPSGTVVTLWAQQCADEDNMNMEFDDEATDATGTNCPPVNVYEIPASALSAFDGELFEGDWTLSINDAFNLDPGTLDSWCLIPTTIIPAPPNDDCANAVPNVLGPNDSVTRTGTTLSSTNTEGFGFGTTGVVWESFTLTDCVETLVVQMCGTNPAHQFWWGILYTDCGLTESTEAGNGAYTCVDGNLEVTFSTVPAGTYYWPIISIPGTPGNPPGPYTVTFVTGAVCPPPPVGGCSEPGALSSVDPVPIIDGETNTGTIEAGPYAPGTQILDMNVYLAVTHTFISDIRIDLTSPSGTTVALWDNGNLVCGGQDNMDVAFDDEAAGVLSCPPLGIYIVPASALSAFDGEDPTGTWTITTNDDFGGDTGEITQWCLIPTTAVVNCTPPSVTADVVADCPTGFSVDLDFTDLGDGAPYTINYTVNGAAQPPVGPVTTTGVVSLTGFLVNDDVDVTITHGSDPLCNVVFNNLTTDCGPGSGCGAYSASPNLVVSNANPTPATSSIIVPAQPPGTAVTDMNVYVNITHTWSADVSMTLTSPNGTVVALALPNAGFGEDCGSADNFIVEFDDEAAAALGTVCPLQGIYAIPDEALSGFDIGPFAGTWTLEVSDNFGGDDGTLVSWCLIPTTAVLDCAQPTVVRTVVPDCPGGFEVDLDFIDLADGAPFFIDYTVNGVAQPQAGPVSTTGVFTLTGFAEGDDVDITIVHGEDVLCNLTFNNNTYVCPPPNDECANAVSNDLAPGESVTRTGSTVGSTMNAVEDVIDAFDQVTGFVWESFTLTECVQTLVVQMCGTDPVHDFYWGPLYTDCNGTESPETATDGFTCVDGNLEITFTSVDAGTYYWPLFIAPGFVDAGDYSVTFVAGVACAAPPPNDDCSTAPITVMGAGETVDITGTSLGATAEPGELSGFNLVWERIDLTECVNTLQIDFCAMTDDYSVSQLNAIFTGCPATIATAIFATDNFNDCPNGNRRQTYNNLPAGTYYVTAWEGYAEYIMTVTTSPGIEASAVAVDDPTCTSGTFDVIVTVDDDGGAPATIDWTVDGGPGGSVPAVIGVPTDLGDFANGVEVAVTMSNGSFCSPLDLGSYYSNCPVALVCGAPATPVSHCYSNNETRTFTYTTDPGETITLIFASGSIGLGDAIFFHDGPDDTFPLLPSGNPLTGSLNGLVIISSSNALHVVIQSDGSGSCQDGGAGTAEMNFTAQCTPECAPGNANITESSDCLTYGFTLTVEITDLGAGLPFVPPLTPETEIFLSYSVNGGTPVALPDPYVVDDIVVLPPTGSFTIGDDVEVILVHASDPLCNRTFGPFDGDTGCPPPGENCSNAIVIASVPTTVSGSTIEYLPGIPYANDLTGTDCEGTGSTGLARDVVYSYTPPVNQLLNMTLCTGTTNFDTKLYVFANSCDGAAVACDDDGCANPPLFTNAWISSIPALNVTAGTTYYFVVDGWGTEQGNYTLQIGVVTPPANDDCAGAITLTPDAVCTPTTGTVQSASDSGVAPEVCTATDNEDVWYKFVATSTTHVIRVVSSASLNAVVDLRDGGPGGGTCNGTNIACANATAAGGIETITATTLTVGNTYYVRVWHSGAAVPATFTFTICVTGIPANDQCAGAVNIPSAGPFPYTTAAVANFAATNTGDPTPPCQTNSNAGIWYTYTPAVTGSHTISMCQTDAPGSNIPDGIISLWTSAVSCTAPYVTAGCDDDACVTLGLQSIVTTNLNCGTQYYILASGFGTNRGAIQLRVSAPSCTVASFDVTGGGSSCDGAGVSVGLSGSALCFNYQLFRGVTPLATLPGTGAALDFGLQTVAGTYTVVATNSAIGTCTGTMAGSAVVVALEPGDACDQDPGPAVVPGQLTATCECGPVTCVQQLELVFQTDNNPTQLSWQIRAQGSGTIVLSGPAGSIVAPNGEQIVAAGCVPAGCFFLRVIDAGGDGITNGGYILRMAGGGARIIDNRNNFTDLPGGPPDVSVIFGNEGFCFPVGANTTQPIYTSCDKLDWVTGEYFVVSEVPAVSQQWSAGNGPNEATSGYETWIYNPNGGYSFKRFRSHNQADGFSPDNAVRACHMKINSWGAPNLIPTNVLMNVRVRTRIAGVNSNWGPACRFKIDPVRAACPLSKLMDIPGNQFYSCGVNRAFVNTQRLTARPITGANKYQFRFRRDSEGFMTVRTANGSNYFVELGWATNPLEVGKTYDVEVRVSKNNGASWCVDTNTPAPGPNFTPWGDVCQVTIVAPVNGGNQNMEMENTAGLRMYPNPNRGDQLFLGLEGIEQGVQTVSVDIFDLFGKVVSTRTIAVTEDGSLNTLIDLQGEMANGMYLVNITAGDKRFIERLVIEK